MDNSEAEVMGSQHTSLLKHKIIETNSENGSQTSMESSPSQTKKRKNTRKDKVEETQMKDDPCGICLAEGVTSRGKLSCCDHCFCFACIFEWSKVENRCPTCRQRFTTIFKMGHSSKFLIFRIPVRDQVHVPTDEDIAAQDPYADVYCSECNSGNDDNLLLLCDLCDLAAHTYCVGLGRTVPTGEWYCRYCESSYNVSYDTEEDEDKDFVPEFHNKCTSSSSRSMTEASSTAETVATFNLRAALPSSLMSKHASNTPSLSRRPKRVIHRQVPRLSNAARAFRNPPPVSITVPQVSRPTSAVHSRGARTLSDRRLLQERIQAMRENWESLQQGELQFSSRDLSVSNRIVDRANAGTQSTYKNCLNENRQRIDSQTDIDQAWVLMEHAKSLGAKDLGFDDHREVARSHKAEKSHPIPSSRIDKKSPQFSSRNLNVSNRIVDKANTGPQSAHKSCLNENRQRIDGQTDINQAWVLMERAKSLGSKDLGFDDHEEVSRSHKVKKSYLLSSSRFDKQLLQFSSRNLSVSNRIVDRANTGTQSAYNNCLNENKQRIDSQTDIGQASVLMECAKSLGAKDLGFDNCQEVARFHKSEKSHLLSSSHIDKQLLDASSRPHTNSRLVERTAVDSRVGRTSIGHQSHPVLKDRLSSVGFTLQPSSECSVKSSKIYTFQTGDCEKIKGSNHAPTTTIHTEEHAERLSVNLSGRSNKAEASAKEVILSLVKTHLTPIYKTKRLGSDHFKEIARMSTHTILAACGLEHSEQTVQHLKKITCCHSEKQRLFPSLMCMCCNECFGVFVKDVVNSIAQKQLKN